MATRKVTVSLDAVAVSYGERAAAAAGVSFSSWLSRAARREAVRTGIGPSADGAEAEAVADEREHAVAAKEMRAAG
ncbi:MAG: hypothetical protein L0I76_03880 [Pseudonocardia sp.]|nr:hypothetical protein [Pseudonocardia sp.]